MFHLLLKAQNSCIMERHLKWRIDVVQASHIDPLCDQLDVEYSILCRRELRFQRFRVFFSRRFGLRRRGPNTHSSENYTELLVSGPAFLDEVLGPVKYTKSNMFAAAIFQNSPPACIITPSRMLFRLFGGRCLKTHCVKVTVSATKCQQ